MTIELTFYTTDGCHLCEEAKSLLQQLLAKHPECYQIEVIDIADSDGLIEQYGTRIPVVKTSAGNDDLGWPFDYASLLAYVES
ncbi:MAG TPA: glutaredoxin family protein [Cycloclasticus sp.]|jgi:glutaredoxin|nr:glutaredoxin family protein [Cycloclasticus sp.]HIL91617.1 glutaredoxin family protein [Cycloclasticus sp.]